MRIAALLVALFSMTIGVVGLVRPDSLTSARQRLMAIPGILYVTGPVRIAMAAALIVFAPKSRAPRMLRAIGVILALQGIIPLLIGQEGGRAILAREVALGTTALRAGATVALATGVFILGAAMPRRADPVRLRADHSKLR